MTNLGPPLTEHGLGVVAGVEALRVNKAHSDWLESCLHHSVEIILFSDVLPVDGLPSIPLEKELPKILVVDAEIISILLVFVQVLIDVLSLLAFDFASSEQVLATLVLLTELVSIEHGTRMHFGEVGILIQL